jgi:predicted kinase
MPTLYLMCGLSFSGKTTIALNLAKSQQAVLISLDEINKERGLGFGGDGLIPPNEWRKTHEIALHRLEAHMDSETDIVLDDTNCFRFLRDSYREVASERGYKTLVVVMKVSLEEIERRRLRNTEGPTRNGIREEVFRHLLDHFEWPAVDEETIGVESLDLPPKNL